MYKYNEEHYNRIKTRCRMELAFQQVKQNPILLALFLPIVVVTIGVWVKMDILLTAFDPPKVLLQIYEITVKAIGVIIPIILSLTLIEAIGSLTAREDEKKILKAFDEQDLKNGSPILIYKNKDKARGYITRAWIFPVSLKALMERQDKIEHYMVETIIRELDYDERAKDNRIVMISVKGMRREKEDNTILDNELEKDMEKF